MISTLVGPCSPNLNLHILDLVMPSGSFSGNCLQMPATFVLSLSLLLSYFSYHYFVIVDVELQFFWVKSLKLVLLWLCERNAVLPLKCGSSCCHHKIHWIPVFFLSLVIFIVQSTSTGNGNGDYKHFCHTAVSSLKLSVSFPLYTIQHVVSLWMAFMSLKAFIESSRLHQESPQYFSIPIIKSLLAVNRCYQKGWLLSH